VFGGFVGSVLFSEFEFGKAIIMPATTANANVTKRVAANTVFFS